MLFQEVHPADIPDAIVVQEPASPALSRIHVQSTCLGKTVSIAASTKDERSSIIESIIIDGKNDEADVPKINVILRARSIYGIKPNTCGWKNGIVSFRWTIEYLSESTYPPSSLSKTVRFEGGSAIIK